MREMDGGRLRRSCRNGLAAFCERNGLSANVAVSGELQRLRFLDRLQMVQETLPTRLFPRVGVGRGDQLAQVLFGLLFGLILQGKQSETGERKAVKRLQ